MHKTNGSNSNLLYTRITKPPVRITNDLEASPIDPIVLHYSPIDAMDIDDAENFKLTEKSKQQFGSAVSMQQHCNGNWRAHVACSQPPGLTALISH